MMFGEARGRMASVLIAATVWLFPVPASRGQEPRR